MYGFQKFKFSFLFLLAILASGLFFVYTSAYEYNLGASRKYYNGANAYVIGTGDNTGYEKDYFTGLGFCTGYYYVNHYSNIADGTDNDISTARQVFDYDESNVAFVGSYINSKLNGGSTAWNVDKYGAFGNDFRFDIARLDTNAPYIPKTYTLGRFSIINTNIISDTTLLLKYLSPKSLSGSTYIDHTNSTFDADYDSNYSFDIKYYAQPCIPDMPITTVDIQKINGANGNESATRLSRVPAFDGLSVDNNAGRPVTLGSVTDDSNFTPASKNLNLTFDKNITFDSGIFIAAIKEPDKSSAGPAYDQGYYYSAGSAKGSGFDLLDSNFVQAPLATSNQWGINPDTVKVIISFTGVDKTNFGDNGSACTVIVTGSALGLSGLGYSWNRNQLGYSVNISSGDIRLFAHNQCAGLSSIAVENIDLKRETVANISWDAYDLSNSMIISQDYNTVEYANPNRIVGNTGYSFNSYHADPILSMSTDHSILTDGSIVYNIPVDNSQLLFTGTDVYAGVDSGTFLIIVRGYDSNTLKSNDRRILGAPTYTYTFSGVDIIKTPINFHNGRYDYIGSVDFASHGTVITGMHFTVHFEVEDFVGNKTEKDYIFRTPTYPNAPIGGPESVLEQSNEQINTIYMLSDIDQDQAADGDAGDLLYDYETYYPSSTGLITKFEYISGSTYISNNTNIVVTAHNGNDVNNSMVTLTGISFVYDNENSYFTGTPHISSGGVPINNYLDTTFVFEVLATNIYGITGVIKYNITVAPSCSESPGCTDPVYVFWGTDLAAAQAQRNSALISGTAYMQANHWYPHWFAEIKQTGPNFYFTGVDLEPDSKVLYCASTGNSLLINYVGYTGPQSNPQSNPTSPTFTGTTLNITGSDVFLFDVFTASISADYVTENINGADRMTIYVNRPLTGRVFYSVCELTVGSLAFGCPENPGHNRTGDVNWTKLTDQDVFTMTGWVEGGWITGSQASYWATGVVSHGGGTRKYIKNITGDLQNDINTNGVVSINIENRTGSTDAMQYEVYWIDNAEVSITGLVSVVANQSAIVTLSGYNTGQLSNSSVSNLIGDDEYIVTKFSGNVEPSLFESGYGSAIHTGDFYINGSGSEYKMLHNIVFAEDREGQICVEDRAGNESCIDMDVSGIGTMQELMITIKPAFRPEPSVNATGYSIVDGNFWFWVKSGSVWTQNYNSAKNADPKIDINKNGTGLVYIMTPASGAEYLVVFKGSGTLSAGFTGIWSDTISELNFFTGTYADQLSNDYVYKFNNAGTIEHYLKVGDIGMVGSGQYDYIYTEDFAIINNNLTIGATTTHKYRYDFDINDVISSMEQSMVLQAFGSHGFIGWLEYNNIIPMTGFVNL